MSPTNEDDIASFGDILDKLNRQDEFPDPNLSFHPLPHGAHTEAPYSATRPSGHLFRCPLEGCDLKGKIHWSRYCDSQHYEEPEGRLLRIVGLLPRCSAEWKAEYKKRPIIERYFSSGKHSRLLDTHRCLNIFKVSLHVAMSMLAYLATALAHLQADDYAHMRHMRIKFPKARCANRNRRLAPTPACRDPGCRCCTWWREVA